MSRKVAQSIRRHDGASRSPALAACVAPLAGLAARGAPAVKQSGHFVRHWKQLAESHRSGRLRDSAADAGLQRGATQRS
jgi:hypothetical protein